MDAQGPVDPWTLGSRMGLVGSGEVELWAGLHMSLLYFFVFAFVLEFFFVCDDAFVYGVMTCCEMG